jgi:hypothetical protein
MTGILHDNVAADGDIRSSIGRNRDYVTKSRVSNSDSLSCGVVQAEK